MLDAGRRPHSIERHLLLLAITFILQRSRSSLRSSLPLVDRSPRYQSGTRRLFETSAKCRVRHSNPTKEAWLRRRRCPE